MPDSINRVVIIGVALIFSKCVWKNRHKVG